MIVVPDYESVLETYRTISARSSAVFFDTNAIGTFLYDENGDSISLRLALRDLINNGKKKELGRILDSVSGHIDNLIDFLKNSPNAHISPLIREEIRFWGDEYVSLNVSSLAEEMRKVDFYYKSHPYGLNNSAKIRLFRKAERFYRSHRDRVHAILDSLDVYEALGPSDLFKETASIVDGARKLLKLENDEADREIVIYALYCALLSVNRSTDQVSLISSDGHVRNSFKLSLRYASENLGGLFDSVNLRLYFRYYAESGDMKFSELGKAVT